MLYLFHDINLDSACARCIDGVYFSLMTAVTLDSAINGSYLSHAPNAVHIDI